MQPYSKKIVMLFVNILMISLVVSCSGITQGKNLVFEKMNRGHLITSATQAYRAGNYEEAANYYKKVLIHNQDDATVAYNLACCYGLQGDAENAAKFVTHAFANGFRQLPLFMEDPDFDPVRNDQEFQHTVDEIVERFKSVGKLDYVAASSLLPYRIRFPKDYDASKRYPLLIGMHGNGGSAEGFISHYDKLDNPQVIFVTPEGQYPRSINVGPQWHSRTWSINSVGKKVWKVGDELVSDYIMKTIKKVSSEYKVSDIYLMGFSQGAVYAYTIGLQHADVIKGVIGFSGYMMDPKGGESILTKEDVEQADGLRLYIAHGIDDAAISVDKARELKSYFESQGFDLTYTEFEGRHGVKADVFNDAVSWMQL